MSKPSLSVCTESRAREFISEYLSDGNNGRAIRFGLDWLKCHRPETPHIMALMAVACTAAGQYEQADRYRNNALDLVTDDKKRRTINELASIDPQGATMYMHALGDLGPLSQGVLSAHPERTLESLARKRLGMKDYATAKQHLQAVWRDDPDNVAVYNNLGYIAIKEGDYAEARKQLEHALSLDPKLAQASYNLALIDLLEKKDRQAADRLWDMNREHIDRDALFMMKKLAKHGFNTRLYNERIRELEHSGRIDGKTARELCVDFLSHAHQSAHRAPLDLAIEEIDAMLETMHKPRQPFSSRSNPNGPRPSNRDRI